MAIALKLQGSHITFDQHQVMLGEGCLALLADISEPVAIQPYSHARIATPIAFTGDGRTMALIDMHAGRIKHMRGSDEQSVASHGEYFLPAPGVEAFVDVEVVNDTGAILMILPNTKIGELTFVNISSDSDAEAADAPLAMAAHFDPLHIPASARPAYEDGASGICLKADLHAPITVAPNSSAIITTGLSVAIPLGHEGHIRASADLTAAVTVENRPIDAGADAIVTVVISNKSDEAIVISPADTIAQLVVTPVSCPRLIYPANDTTGR